MQKLSTHQRRVYKMKQKPNLLTICGALFRLRNTVKVVYVCFACSPSLPYTWLTQSQLNKTVENINCLAIILIVVRSQIEVDLLNNSGPLKPLPPKSLLTFSQLKFRNSTPSSSSQICHPPLTQSAMLFFLKSCPLLDSMTVPSCFSSYLSHRYLSVSSRGSSLSTLQLSVEIPQGCVLGPLLFSLGNLHCKYKFSYHFCADTSQIYLFTPHLSPSVQTKVTTCHSDSSS